MYFLVHFLKKKFLLVYWFYKSTDPITPLYKCPKNKRNRSSSLVGCLRAVFSDIFLLQRHYSEAAGHSGAPLTEGLMLFHNRMFLPAAAGCQSNTAVFPTYPNTNMNMHQLQEMQPRGCMLNGMCFLLLCSSFSHNVC